MMGRGSATLRQFLSELRRRRVFRVAGVYVVAAWALLQVATTVAPILRLPDWAPAFALFVLLLGFPVALVLAWAYEITPDGVRRTDPEAPAPLPGETSSRRDVARYGASAPYAPRPLAYLGFSLLLALVAVAAYVRFRSPRPQAKIPAESATVARISAVAVLPFVDMSERRDQEYFSDGITEEILDALAQIPELRVTSRTSSFAFRGRQLPLGEIARRLGVGAVLEGSVQRQGDRVRVVAQLIDARTDQHLWSQTYDRELKDVFAVEDEISRAIAGQLQRRLAGGASTAKSVAQRPATTSTQAHDLYLLGLQDWNRRGAAPLRNAASYFQQAIALDSSYAEAYAGLAMTYTLFGEYMAGPHAGYQARAAAAARKALSLDGTLADAHAALARTQFFYDYDWKGSEAEFRAALALNPNDGTVHQWYALLLSAVGRRGEALQEADRAIALNPLSLGDNTGRAVVLYQGRRFAEAAAQYQRALIFDSTSLLPRINLVRNYLAAGRLDAAAPEFRRWARFAGLPPAEADAILLALAQPARRGEARRVLARWEALPVRPLDTPLLAALYDRTGDRAHALAVLERGFRNRELRMAYLAAEPLLDSLHSEPRFRAILRQMHLAL